MIKLLGVLFLCGLVLHYVWWILAALAIWAIVWMARKAFADLRQQESAEAERRAAILKRANQQHRQALRGDDRGVYGLAWPAVQKYQRLAKK